MSRFGDELSFAHELADLADEQTLPAFHAGPRVRRKADGTRVTDTDRDVEARLREHIRARYPDHAILGEEQGLVGPGDAPTWILDPIDGTTNFVRGNPIFATLIALRVSGEEAVGVVSAPGLGSRWDGVRGGPAHRDGRMIEVSPVTDLSASEVSLGGLGYFEQRGLLAGVGDLVRATDRQRGYGDFWQHCLVAGGSTEAAIDAEVSLWDLAALKCIVEAAGGRFTDLDGRATADGGSGVSSNGAVHDTVLAVLHGRGGAGPAGS